MLIRHARRHYQEIGSRGGKCNGSPFKWILEGKNEIAMPKAVYLQVSAMYFYGMARNMYFKIFLGGGGGGQYFMIIASWPGGS